MNKDQILSFKDLSVWICEDKSWFRKKQGRKKVLVKNVSGWFKQGEFTAILGPSGAGKTTLLSALAGRCQQKWSGSVTLGGTDVGQLPRGVVNLVPQHDVFMNSLTVGEHLRFMTEMKLGSWKKPYNRFRFKVLLQELMLQKLTKTVIQNLSGGEKRLLSLATSLLSYPRVILVDEPTTGLDCSSASLVVRILKQIAAGGVTVICSIHQPSSGVFAEFDTVMLVNQGRLLIHGTHDQCREVFQSVGKICPKNYNPAEFYIRVISHQETGNSNLMTQIESGYKLSHGCNIVTGFDVWGESELQAKLDNPNVSRRHWIVQVYLLLWRYSLTWKQEWKQNVIQLLITMLLSGLVTSVCFSTATSLTQAGVVSTIGYFNMFSTEICFNMAYNALHTFSVDLALFKREAGVYSCSAFYVSRLLCYIPRCIIMPIGYVLMATLVVDLPNKFTTILQFIASLVANSVAATAYGLGAGALFCASDLVNEILPCFDFPLWLMSGIFINLSSLPAWGTVVQYLSQFYYGMDALNNIYWRQVTRIECDGPSDSCFTDGLSVLQGYGYTSWYLVDTLGFLGITVMWSLLGYLGVWRETNKGYAF